MTAVCDAPQATGVDESVFCRRRILRWNDERLAKAQIEQFGPERMADSYVAGKRRYSSLHTANSAPMTSSAVRLTPTTRKSTVSPPVLPHRVSVLVTALLKSIATTTTPYGSHHPDPDDHLLSDPHAYLDQSLAHACILTDTSSPCDTTRRRSLKPRRPASNMDFDVDFGSNAGFRERAKKKKGGAAAKFDPWGDSEKKDDALAGEDNAAGGEGGSGSGGDAGGGGAGGGGDDDNGDNGAEDDWGFSTGKKNKKKSKKKQEEEEEEAERIRKGEENAANGANTADPLSWADDMNNDAGAAGDDWTNSWTTGKKDKKKKNGTTAPAAPEPPTSAFQDISLDDGALKLDFSFDGIGSGKDTKTNGASFSTWGNAWEFNSGKDDSKTDSPSFGSNNPWSAGAKSKKNANTMSSFDFGDFGSSNKNTLSYNATDDTNNNATSNDMTDDAWGFATSTKKEKKKKGGIEEIKEEPETTKDAENWPGWDAPKTKKKITNAFDDEFLNTANEATTTKPEDNTFDWDFGSKKNKKKDSNEPAASADLNASTDAKGTKTDSNDPWAAFSTAKDKKKTKSGMFGDISTSGEPEPAANDSFGWGGVSSSKKNTKTDAFGFDLDTKEESQPELTKPLLVAWDAGLSSKDKRKLEKEMKMNGTWFDRVTQEMVDEQAAAAAAAEAHVSVIENVAKEPEHSVEKVAWDAGLTAVKKRKKEREMRENGTWESRVTQEMIDEEKAAVVDTSVPKDDTNALPLEPEAGSQSIEPPLPPEDLVPWDHGLSAVKKRKKERDMRAEGTWEDRLTEEKIKEMTAAAKSTTSPVNGIKDDEKHDDFHESKLSSSLALPVERVAWDHGLTPARKKKKEKEMKLDGTWESRITQEQIDDETLAATLQSATLDSPAADDLLSPLSPPPPPPAPSEPKVAWDSGLTPARKKKKEKEMKLDGTWESRITQEQIDAEAVAASLNPIVVEELDMAAETSMSPSAVVEERIAWDFGLTPAKKRKKERDMKLDGTWETRITQEQIDADATVQTLDPTAETVSEDITPGLEKEPRVAWDYGLSLKDKKKKEREMRFEGTWEDRITQEMIDEEEAQKKHSAVPESDLVSKLDFGFGTNSAKEERVAWDHGLSAKEKKRREKEMRLDLTWDDRITQEMIDAEKEEAVNDVKDTGPEPKFDATSEERVAWDNGLDAKARKKKEKEMKLNFTWDDRVTQEMLDAEHDARTNSEAHAQNKTDESAVAEPRVAWDHGLDAKARKKKERDMKLNYTWEDRITQEMIDAENEAKAQKADQEAFSLEAEKDAVEPRLAWDHGLDAKARRRKEREMKLNYTWEDRITQEMIDEENTTNTKNPDPVVEEEVQPVEPRLPWDHGLTPMQKRKKEKAMRAEGIWEDRLTQEKIDEEAATAQKVQESSRAAEPAGDGSNSGGWGFGWGTGTKGAKNSISALDPELEKQGDTVDDKWGTGWGSSKEKTKDKDISGSKQEKDDDIWGFAATTDTKKKDKDGKKAGVASPSATGAPSAPIEDDIWATFGASTKSDKKDKKGKKAEDSVTQPDLMTEILPASESAGLPNVDDFNWDGLGSGRKSNKTLVEETPAKKSGSSLWGFGTTSSTSKSKKDKEKEVKAKKEAEEAEAIHDAEREAAKTAENKASKGKTSKTAVTTNNDLLDLLDEPVPATSTSKLKKSTKSSDTKVDDLLDDTRPTTDYFGSWGASTASKKTVGKKATKEINSTFSTNEMDDLPELNEDEIQAVLDEFPTSSSNKLPKNMSHSKIKTSSSIADKIKAFEVSKEVSGKKPKVKDASIGKDETALKEPLSPIEEKKATKTKASTSTSSKHKNTSSPPAEAKQKSKDSVPGGFPGAFDFDVEEEAKEDVNESPPVLSSPTVVKSSTKTMKAEAKLAQSTKSSKTKRTSVTFDRAMDANGVVPVLLNNGEPAEPITKLPTPPPDEKTSSKKERPKVAATSSWGIFGATPTSKRSSKSKTADDVSPSREKKLETPTRSKSSRTPKEKSGEEKREPSKSSGSEADSTFKKSDKPKLASRGLSFTNFMLGGPPPSAMRDTGPLKRSNTSDSRPSSRRHSADLSGLLSPPTDEDKTRKRSSQGLQRRSSSKQKSRSYPDPYAIDEGDMIVVDNADEVTGKAKTAERKSSRRSSTKPRSKTISGDEDIVMVESPAAAENGVLSGGDDLERPTLLRSNTAKRVGGLFGSLFGGGTRTPTRSQSNPVSDAEDKARSRGTSRKRKSTLEQEASFATDNPNETDAEAAARRKARRAAKEQAEEEERTAREQRRKERRDREKADLEARREKAREQARREREAEEAARIERRARRKAKEAEERAQLEREEVEAVEAAERRREERRRAREQLEAEAGVNMVGKDDRRRAFADEEDLRRSRRKEKSRGHDESKRKSTALMAEYHESRSGSGRGIKPPSNKTSNWVNSQSDELPDPPPLVGTVLDESGQQPRPVEEVDGSSRRRQHRSGKDKYAGMTEEEIAEYRLRRRERKLAEQEKEKSTSAGSDEKRHRRSRAIEDDYYANVSPEPVRTFDGRPSLIRGDSKRNSFLSKFF